MRNGRIYVSTRLHSLSVSSISVVTEKKNRVRVVYSHLFMPPRPSLLRRLLRFLLWEKARFGIACAALDPGCRII